MSFVRCKISVLPVLSLTLLCLLFLLHIVNPSSISYATNDDNNNNCDETNIIIGTRTYTKGTNCDDIIIGCPMTVEGTGCRSGDTLRGL